MAIAIGDAIQAWQDVLSDSHPSVFCVFCLSDDKKSLEVSKSGSGAPLASVLEELRNLEAKRKPAWGGFRIVAVDERGSTRSTRSKFIGFQFVAESCPPMARAKCVPVKAQLNGRILQNCSTFVDVDSVDELADEESLVARLRNCGGAHQPTGYDFTTGQNKCGSVTAASVQREAPPKRRKSLSEAIAEKADEIGEHASKAVATELADGEQKRRVSAIAEADAAAEKERRANQQVADAAAEAEAERRAKEEAQRPSELPAPKRKSLTAINKELMAEEAQEKIDEMERAAAGRAADQAADAEQQHIVRGAARADADAERERTSHMKEADEAEAAEKDRRTNAADVEAQVEEAKRCALAKRSSGAVGEELLEKAGEVERHIAQRVAHVMEDEEQARRVVEDHPEEHAAIRMSLGEDLRKVVPLVEDSEQVK